MLLVEFESSGNQLKGYFFPAGKYPALASIIFLQGFPGIEGDELICEQLAQQNINVLTFNYQGTFQSAGNFSFSNAIGDIGAAIQFITESHFREQFGVEIEKLVLGGWSFGSGLIPAGAARYAEITKLFCISGRNFGAEARRIAQDPEYEQMVFQNLETIRKPKGAVIFQDNVLDDLKNYQETLDPLNSAAKLKEQDILLIGGWNDEISAIEDHLIPFYRALVTHGNPRVQIEALNTDHEFSNCKSQLVEIIVEWIKFG